MNKCARSGISLVALPYTFWLELGRAYGEASPMDPDSRRGGPPTTCHQHIEHAPAAIASYLHKMCAKAAARSQATLSARLVLQQTYQAAVSLHRGAFWHMLERLVTRIRRRSALDRWHRTARARKSERASILSRIC